MRIGMMADMYKPHLSGVTNYISLNKQVFENMGHEVFVFTFGDVNYNDLETNVIRSPGIAFLTEGLHLNIEHSKSARQLLNTMDIVHVHHPIISGSIAWRHCPPKGIPVIFTNHTRYDLYLQAYVPLFADLLGETFLPAYFPAFCRACDLVIAPSEGLRKVLIRMGVDAQVKVIPNGVNLEPFSSSIKGVDRTTFGFGSDHIILAYVGRIGPEKNLPFLVRSFCGISQAYEQVRLLMIGDGPERNNLSDLVKSLGIESKVHFTGWINYEELPAYLAAADIFVTASVSEVHPLSVIEAMASGLPVLGIQSPGVGDTVQDGATGLLSTEDMAVFTAKMSRLITDPNLCRQMGEKARQAAKAYDIQSTSRMVLKEYERLVLEGSGKKKGLRASFSRLITKRHL